MLSALTVTAGKEKTERKKKKTTPASAVATLALCPYP